MYRKMNLASRVMGAAFILRYPIGATFARLFACSIHYRSTESRLFDMMHLEMGCHTSEWFFLRYATFSAISRSARETA